MLFRQKVMDVFSKKYTIMLWCKGKAIPLQTLTGPEDSSSFRLPDFKIIGI
jgi:hypothetical protein